MGSLVAEIAERVASSSAGARSELEIRGGLVSPGTLTLSTAEPTVVDGNKLGQIDFQAPVEGSGTDAILVGASIYAEADDTFAADNNATELVFATGASEAAAEKMRLTSDGKVGIGTSVPVTDLTIDGTITLKEQADADGDTAAYGQIWVNTATPNELYFTNDAGNDIAITSGTTLAGLFDPDGAQVFNETGADVDFRIESDDNVNMFFVNAGDDRIGIGTNDPGAHMDIRGPAGSGAATAGNLMLSTAETTVVDGDYLGIIKFRSPLEASGSDATLVAASIHAEADATFSSTLNQTDLVFSTGTTETATEKFRVRHRGDFTWYSSGAAAGMGKVYQKSEHTQGVTNSSVTIMNGTIGGYFMTYGLFCIIAGRNNSATTERFVDTLAIGLNGSINVINSSTVRGSPASRSYGIGSDSLTVTMGHAGAYNITVAAWDFIH